VQSQLEAHSGGDPGKALICPFCREDNAKYDPDDYPANYLKQVLKLANAGHAEAIYHLAVHHFDGEMGLRKDKTEGLRWYHRASEAGSAEAAGFLVLLSAYCDLALCTLGREKTQVT